MTEISFDVEAYRQYIDEVIESQGFYVTSEYGHNLICGIVKIDENDLVRHQGAESAAIFAVDEYNKKEKANLKYMRIVNLNMEPVAGAMYYITLAAMESTGDVNHYQARVWEKINSGFQVQIFRKAPYGIRKFETFSENRGRVWFGNLQPWKDENCLWIGNLKPWMDENYLYHTCFHGVNDQLVSVKVIRDEQSGVSEGFGFLWFETKSAAEEVMNEYKRTPMPYANQCYNITWTH